MNPLQDRSDEEIRVLIGNVTPGPWVGRWTYYDETHGDFEVIGGEFEDGSTRGVPANEVDAVFIAAARDVVPALLARAVAAEAENARLFRELSNQEKFNIESRRSLCALSDTYKAERDVALAQIEVVRAMCTEAEHEIAARPGDVPYQPKLRVADLRLALAEHFPVPVYPTPTGQDQNAATED